MQFVQFVRDAFALLFPELCAACDRALVHQEKSLCTFCIYNLPITYFHLDKDNLAARQLMGHALIEEVDSFLHFSSGSIVQRIIHHIKYKNGYATAELLGKVYGQQLKENSAFESCDLIIPVPLHKKRLRSRGYNQSDYFAKGLGSVLNIPFDCKNLVRVAHNESQTSRSRPERFENVEGIFQLNHPKSLNDKHILLVDDVLTTGATLEACTGVLLQIPGVKVSIATLAFTK
jgi:ComF family protein